MNLEKESNRNVHIKVGLEKELPEKLSKNMEVEIRVGTIIDKATGKRLAIEFMHPCIIKSSETLRFHPSVLKNHYMEIKKCLDSAMGERKENKKIVDTFMAGYRVSKTVEINEKKLEEPQIVCIKKKKMKNIDIFCPESKYDLRIGINMEEIYKNAGSRPATQYSVREKNRCSYKENAYTIDATMVLAGKTKETANEVIYEIEIEANNEEYKKEEFSNVVVNFIEVLKKFILE